MKQKNVKIMRWLTVLLILSNLLIELGLLALIPCADVDRMLHYTNEFLVNLFGPWFFLFILTGIPYAILLVCMDLLCVGLLMTGIGAAAGSVLSAVFAVQSFLKISREDPDQQRKGKKLAGGALFVNTLDTVILLLLDLFLIFLSDGLLEPWIAYALYLCLAGAAVLVIGFITYRMLRSPRNADPKGETESWKNSLRISVIRKPKAVFADAPGNISDPVR